MNYTILGDTVSLMRLSGLFDDLCREQGITMGTLKAITIMVALIDKAKEEGLFIEIPNGVGM